MVDKHRKLTEEDTSVRRVLVVEAPSRAHASEPSPTNFESLGADPVNNEWPSVELDSEALIPFASGPLQAWFAELADTSNSVPFHGHDGGPLAENLAENQVSPSAVK